MIHHESEDTVHAQGTIQHQGITTYMYGSHILVDHSGKTLYALRSSTLDLNSYIGKYVEVSGTDVFGIHPRPDGGPPLLDVNGVQEKRGVYDLERGPWYILVPLGGKGEIVPASFMETALLPPTTQIEGPFQTQDEAKKRLDMLAN